MKTFKIEKIMITSTDLTSSMWFMCDDDVETFMKEKYFKRVGGGPKLVFTPIRIDALVRVDEETGEYELILGFSDAEVVMDFGKVLHKNHNEEKRSLHLSGRILEDCVAVCSN